MNYYGNGRFSEEDYKEIEAKVKELNEYRDYYGRQKFVCTFIRQADGKGCLVYYFSWERIVKEKRSVNTIRKAIDELYDKHYAFQKKLDEIEVKYEAEAIYIPIPFAEKLEWWASGSCMDDSEYGKHYYNDYITCERFTREVFKTFVEEIADVLGAECGECDDIEITKKEGMYDRYIYIFKNHTFRMFAVYYIDAEGGEMKRNNILDKI